MIRNLITFIFILSLATSWLYLLYYLSGPDERLQIPSDFENLVQLKNVFEEYVNQRLFYTLLFYSCVYLYKQTFAIPGSVFMNLISGALFGVIKGFPLCCFLSAFGASCCFLVSKWVGRDVLIKLVPHRIEYFQNMVERNRQEQSLFKFLLSIRIFPMTPNWLINMCSPLVGVPLKSFFLSVLLGLAPYNFITVNAGAALADLKSLDDIMSWKVIFGLGLLSAAILNPIQLVRKVFKKGSKPKEKKKKSR